MAVRTGIVMKTDRNKAYIMTRSGEFLNVKLQGITPEIGSEYTGELMVKAHGLFNIRHAAAAAALAIALLAGGGAYAYNIPVSTVTVSSNPKVQLKTNIFKRVIEVYSPDASITENLNLKNASIDDAVVNVVNSIAEKRENEENKEDKAKTEPVSIDIKGKDIDTSNIKKNLDNKSINYSIRNSNSEKNTEVEGNSSSKKEMNSKEMNSEKKDKISNNKKK